MGSDLVTAHRLEAEDNYAKVCRENANLKLEKDCLRKQTRNYQRDLGLARKILYFVKLRARDKMVRRVAERCLEELKQTS